MISKIFFKKSSQLILFIIFCLLFAEYKTFSATSQLNIEITTPSPVCGNGVREGSEQCDGSDLAGQTCQSRGFSSGVLTCKNNCTFNTSNCIAAGGGGGGGGGVWIPPQETKVIIKGKAYPEAEITLLSDGKVESTTKAGSLANFSIEIKNITPGTWIFSLWAVDKKGRKSITFSFTTNVIQNAITTVSGIFLPPTIELSKTRLQKGEVLDIYGQTAPDSKVTVSVESPEPIVKRTIASKEGDWEQPVDTSPLDDGTHISRAKAESPEGLSSSYSTILSFYVGKEAVRVPPKNADANSDKKVNLVDFSILLYNWGVPKNPAADLNNDGKVNLVDFSIMLYYWTG